MFIGTANELGSLNEDDASNMDLPFQYINSNEKDYVFVRFYLNLYFF